MIFGNDFFLGGGAFSSLWILKRALEIQIINPMGPSEIYSTTLSITTFYAPGYNLQHFPWGLGGFVILKNVISGPFKYV